MVYGIGLVFYIYVRYDLIYLTNIIRQKKLIYP